MRIRLRLIMRKKCWKKWKNGNCIRNMLIRWQKISLELLLLICYFICFFRYFYLCGPGSLTNFILILYYKTTQLILFHFSKNLPTNWKNLKACCLNAINFKLTLITLIQRKMPWILNYGKEKLKWNGHWTYC